MNQSTTDACTKDFMPPQRPLASNPRERSSKRVKTEHSSSKTADWVESLSNIRKRKAFSDNGCYQLVDCKRRRSNSEYSCYKLTEANLRRVPSYESTRSEMSQSLASTHSDRSVKPTDSEYEALLNERGVFPNSDMVLEPSNLEDITRALASTRNSPGPDDITAKNFPKRVLKSGNEGGIMQGLLPKVLPIIEHFWDSKDNAHPVNQQWDRQMLLQPEMQPSISPAKPDQAFGFTPRTFHFPHAALFMKSVMCPTRDLAWPYFTVETKGRQGHLDVARLQNSHNGAIMLNNMLQLKRTLNKEHEILGSMRVITMELTTESISLCGHMVVRNASGDPEFHSWCLSCGSAVDPTGRSFKESYRQAMNAVELMRKQTLDWITTDMGLLEAKLVSSMQQGLNQITPPLSNYESRESQKRGRRGSSRASSRGGSRSLPRRPSTLSTELDP